MKISKKVVVALKSILSVSLGKANTDKGEIVFDGDVLEVGAEVFKMDENDEAVPVEDGEYILDDERTVVVADGKVTEIKEKEVEETATEEEVAEQAVEEVEQAAEEEPEAEPADEPDEVTEEPTEDDRRFAAIAETINEIVNAIAALESRLVEVEGKLAKVEAPAADPIEKEEVEQAKMSRMSYLRK